MSIEDRMTIDERRKYLRKMPSPSPGTGIVFLRFNIGIGRR
jgi:hypothetical protein